MSSLEPALLATALTAVLASAVEADAEPRGYGILIGLALAAALLAVVMLRAFAGKRGFRGDRGRGGRTAMRDHGSADAEADSAPEVSEAGSDSGAGGEVLGAGSDSGAAPGAMSASDEAGSESERGESEPEQPAGARTEVGPAEVKAADLDPAGRPSLRDRLGKARDALASSMGKALGRSSISEETWDEFIEALIQADVGVSASMELVDAARERARAERLSTPAEAVAALRGEICERLRGDRSLSKGSNGDAPSVWLFLGVNGAGKTTTIGKLAMREISSGDRVMLAAGDTFRAAAAEQLDSWATRSGAEIIRGATGADPASVVYDAVESAAAKEIGLVIADTAGRLHTDRNLMDELRKIERVAGRGAGEVTEALLVLDASTGQNGLAQARQFAEAVNLTGVVLTKLDGSARGGIVLAVQDELGIPVKLVGVGEGVADLVTFDEEEFASALLG